MSDPFQRTHTNSTQKPNEEILYALCPFILYDILRDNYVWTFYNDIPFACCSPARHLPYVLHTQQCMYFSPYFRKRTRTRAATLRLQRIPDARAFRIEASPELANNENPVCAGVGSVGDAHERTGRTGCGGGSSHSVCWLPLCLRCDTAPLRIILGLRRVAVHTLWPCTYFTALCAVCTVQHAAHSQARAAVEC